VAELHCNDCGQSTESSITTNQPRFAAQPELSKRRACRCVWHTPHSTGRNFTPGRHKVPQAPGAPPGAAATGTSPRMPVGVNDGHRGGRGTDNFSSVWRTHLLSGAPANHAAPPARGGRLCLTPVAHSRPDTRSRPTRRGLTHSRSLLVSRREECICSAIVRIPGPDVLAAAALTPTLRPRRPHLLLRAGGDTSIDRRSMFVGHHRLCRGDCGFDAVAGIEAVHNALGGP